MKKPNDYAGRSRLHESPDDGTRINSPHRVADRKEWTCFFEKLLTEWKGGGAGQKTRKLSLEVAHSFGAGQVKTFMCFGKHFSEGLLDSRVYESL